MGQCLYSSITLANESNHNVYVIMSNNQIKVRARSAVVPRQQNDFMDALSYLEIIHTDQTKTKEFILPPKEDIIVTYRQFVNVLSFRKGVWILHEKNKFVRGSMRIDGSNLVDVIPPIREKWTEIRVILYDDDDGYD